MVKSNGLGRPAFDADMNNFHTVKVPTNTPLPADFRKVFFSSKWAFVLDLKSYFPQIPLLDGIGLFFALRLANGSWRYHRAMAQGWVYASQVGQATARTILKGIEGVLPYQDNWAGAAESEDGVYGLLDRVKDRCRLYGAVIKEGSVVVGQCITQLGVQYDLSLARWRLCPSWAAKAGAKVTAVVSTPNVFIPLLAWWRVFGTCLWALYVFDLPYSTMPHVLRAMSNLTKGREIQNIDWLEYFSLDIGVLEDLSILARLLLVNPWRYHHGTVPGSIMASDASTTGGGWIIYLRGCGDTPKPMAVMESAWAWRYHHVSTEIFILELVAAIDAIMAWVTANPGTTVVLAVDNVGVMFALRKGHCAHYGGNLRIRELYRVLRTTRSVLVVCHFPTEWNPADSLSRMFDPRKTDPLFVWGNSMNILHCLAHPQNDGSGAHFVNSTGAAHRGWVLSSG